MERAELLEKLNAVSAALSGNNLIPVLERFWFTGSTVMAYNDQIALSAPCKTPFAGAVPKELLPFLEATGVKNINFDPEQIKNKLTEQLEDRLKVSAAGAKLTFALMPPDSFLFKMPTPANKLAAQNIQVTKSMREQIECCMRSVSDDSSMPDRLGITFYAEDDKHLSLFSTNGKTISQANHNTAHSLKKGDRVSVHGLFCTQLLAMSAEEDDKAWLQFATGHALAGNAKGVLLFGRLIDVPKPLDFHKIIENHTPDKPQFIEKPKLLDNVLARAKVITNSLDQQTTHLTVENAVGKYVSRSQSGEVIDNMDMKKHPNVKMKFDPGAVKDALESFDEILFTDRCVIMAAKNRQYLIAAVGN